MISRLSRYAPLVLALLLAMHTALCACPPAVISANFLDLNYAACVQGPDDSHLPGESESHSHVCPHCRHTFTAERSASLGALTAFDQNAAPLLVAFAPMPVIVESRHTIETTQSALDKPMNVVARLHCALTL